MKSFIIIDGEQYPWEATRFIPRNGEFVWVDKKHFKVGQIDYHYSAGELMQVNIFLHFYKNEEDYHITS